MKEQTLVHLELNEPLEVSLRQAMRQSSEAASKTAERLFLILHSPITDLRLLQAAMDALYLVPDYSAFKGEVLVFFSDLVNQDKIPADVWIFEPSNLPEVAKENKEKIERIASSILESLKTANQPPVSLKESNKAFIAGTFDSMHRGHKVYLSFGALLTRVLIVGFTSNEIVGYKKNSELIEPYSKRVFSVVEFLSTFDKSLSIEMYKMKSLDDIDFLKADIDTSIDSDSEEYEAFKYQYNPKRAELGLPPVKTTIFEIRAKTSSTELREAKAAIITEDQMNYLKQSWYQSLEELEIEGPQSEIWLWRLFELYFQPWRKYHNLQRISDLCQKIDKLANFCSKERAFLKFAVFFRDAIYVPSSEDNERRSAQLLGEFFQSLPEKDKYRELWYQLNGLILAAATHDLDRYTQQRIESEIGDLGQIFLDLDISFLAEDRSTYQQYLIKIGLEQSYCPQVDSRNARITFLKETIRKGSLLFKSSQFFHLNKLAMENINWELDQLSSRSDSLGSLRSRINRDN